MHDKFWHCRMNGRATVREVLVSPLVLKTCIVHTLRRLSASCTYDGTPSPLRACVRASTWSEYQLSEHLWTDPETTAQTTYHSVVRLNNRSCSRSPIAAAAGAATGLFDGLMSSACRGAASPTMHPARTFIGTGRQETVGSVTVGCSACVPAGSNPVGADIRVVHAFLTVARL